jgi:hypothetical protein
MRGERTARVRAAGPSAALLAAAGWLTAGCGPAPGTFHPAGATAAAAPGHPSGTAGQVPGTAGRGTGGDLLSWPPFGANVHIVMPGWLPRVRSEIPAVIVAKDFLLAYLYAEYRGNQDDRWTGYVSGPVRGALESNLTAPDVTTESFTGTIIFSHLSAFPDPSEPGAVDVSECFDNARSANTSLATGKIVPDHGAASRHYYLNTDVLAVRNGHWRVISVDPVIYYPQTRECKPVTRREGKP